MKSRCELTFALRLLPTPLTAAYLDVSEPTLRGLDLPRKIQGGKRLYDRLTLDEHAFALPSEDEAEEANPCDGKFGMRR